MKKSCIKYLLCILIMILAAGGFPVSALASEDTLTSAGSQINLDFTSTSAGSLTNLDFTSEQQAVSEDFIQELLDSGLIDMEVGEQKEIGIAADGSPIYAVSVSKEEYSIPAFGALARAAVYTYSTNTIIVRAPTTSGTVVDAVSVFLECYWYKDGYDSHISNFTATRQILNNNFSWAWTGSSSSSPVYHTIGFNLYRNGLLYASNTVYALINIAASPVTITLGI
jgi:hypothetical protein